MYKIENIGTFDTLPDPALAIYQNNLKEMRRLYQNGWNINQKMKLGEYTTITPLEIAVVMNKYDLVEWLVEHQVSLDVEGITIIETAAQHSGKQIIDLLLENNALNFLPKKKYSEIFIRIYVGKKYENIEIFERIGITVTKYGGAALRLSASKGDLKDIQFWVEKGADVNYHKPDMVFPYASTPLIEAIRFDHTEVAKYLIKSGSDVTIIDKYGERAYTVASENKNSQLIELIKSIEPAEWHDEQEKLKIIKSYKMPAKMLDYLKSSPNKVQLSEKSDDSYPTYIVFYQFMDLQEIKWKRKKLLSLIEEVDNYEMYIVWSPSDKAICYLDYEHEEFYKLCSWKEFINDPAKYVNKIIDGEIYD